jgi:PST family polysaccharide transporter
MSSDLNAVIDPEFLKQRSVMGGAATLVAQGLRFLIRLTAQIAIARLLVPADYGLVAMVAPFIGLVQLVADLGLGQAVVQHANIQQQEISALFWLGLAVNIAMAVLVALLSPLLAWLYDEPRLILISVVLAGLIPVAGLTTQPAALLSRNLRFHALAMLDVAPPAVGLVAGLTAACLGLGYWSLIISAASESIFGTGLIWCLSSWRPSFGAIGKSAWPLVRKGGHLTAFNLAQYLTTTFDNILIAITQGAVALGLYDKAYKMVTQPVGQLLTPANRVAIPLLVRLLPEPDRYKRAYVSMLQVLLLFGVPGILFVLMMSKELVLTLLGPRWNGIAPIVSWFCLGSFASPLYSSTSWLFISQGLSGQQLRYGVITSIVSVVGFAAGLPWGPAGVAAGAGLSFFFLATPLTCWGATRTGPVKSEDLFFAILPLLVALAGTAATLTVLISFVAVQGIGLVLAFIATYGSFFSVLLCLPGGRDFLRKVWELRTMFNGNQSSKDQKET